MKKYFFLFPAILILLGAGCINQEKAIEQQKRIKELEEQVGVLIEQTSEKEEPLVEQEPAIIQKDSSAGERIADYLEKQEQEKQREEFMANCKNSANIIALIERQKASNSPMGYLSSAPSQCQSYDVDLDKISQNITCNNTYETQADLYAQPCSDKYTSAMNYWSEQVKLFSDCVYQIIYAQEYNKCLNQ